MHLSCTKLKRNLLLYILPPFQMLGKMGTFTNLNQSYSVMDCRGLVKTLVSGVKTITWGISSCKTSAMGNSYQYFHDSRGFRYSTPLK